MQSVIAHGMMNRIMNENAPDKAPSALHKALKIIFFPFLIMVNPKIYFLDLEDDEGSSDEHAHTDSVQDTSTPS